MNYLAHLALSGPIPDMQVGGFLGDWLKGPIEKHSALWPDQVIQGVTLHRKIDTWVDQQPETLKALQLLGASHRRIAGPVIDIAFDHFLARDFSRFHKQPLADFCQAAFVHLNAHRDTMPEPAQRFLQRAQSHKLFERYADLDTFLGVVASLRKRLSKPSLLDGIEDQLIANYQPLEMQFQIFYPKLCTYVLPLRASTI